MTNAEFIKLHYSSFIDNVLTNQTPEFWGQVAKPHDRILVDDFCTALYDAVMQWRERVEAHPTTTYHKRPHKECAGDIMEVCPEGDCPPCHKGRDDKWWDAIDKDEKYQQEQDR